MAFFTFRNYFRVGGNGIAVTVKKLRKNLKKYNMIKQFWEKMQYYTKKTTISRISNLFKRIGMRLS